MDIIINDIQNELPLGHSRLPHPGSFYQNILSVMGYPLASPPVADLLARYHGLSGEWLVASPICWEATHNDAMIIASGDSLDLSEEASKAWFDVFRESVDTLSCQAVFHDSHTWLIQMDDKPAISAKPPNHLHHQSMMPHLAVMDQTLFWQRFFTENQMFFSAHPLNQARIASFPINGLWIWGQGQLDAPSKTPIYCDEAFHSLAQNLSSNVRSIEPHQSINEGVVFTQRCTDDLLDHLKQPIKKQRMRWYWNNVAYASKPTHWLWRLLERR